MPRKNDKELTHLECVNAQPRASEYALYQAGGLCLVIKPDGGKRWLYRFSLHGKRCKQWLGYFPDVGVAEARERRDEAAKLVEQGKSPATEKRLEKAKQALDASNTFEVIAREWHAKQLPRYTSEAHGLRVIGSLEKDAFPALGKMPIGAIEAPHVLATIRAIEKRGAIETAQRVLQRVGAVMRYAIQTGRAKVDPTYKLSETLTAVKVEHRPAMPRKELPEYFRRLELEPLYPLTRCGLELLAYTFVRPGELRFARWEEFDMEAAEWRIPAERMKMRAPHIVPLSRQALAVLDELRNVSGNAELLFPAQTDRTKPMSENTLGYALGRMGYQGVHCPHGFRSLASTILNEEGFDADVIERQLAHAPKDKVRAAYHRAQYLKERRELLQWWADFLDSKRPGANVVPMKAKAA